jgi:hypothetical protein
MPDIEFLRSVKERTGLTPFLFVALMTDIRAHLFEQAGGGLLEEEAEEPEPLENVIDEATILEAADWQKGLEIFDEADQALQESPASATKESESSFLGGEDDESWKNIFDTGNESVLKEMDE